MTCPIHSALVSDHEVSQPGDQSFRIDLTSTPEGTITTQSNYDLVAGPEEFVRSSYCIGCRGELPPQASQVSVEDGVVIVKS